MTKVAYLDCPTGLSGDMCLGALVHAGVPLFYLREQLQQLGIADEYALRTELVHRNGQQATKFHVELQHSPSHLDARASTSQTAASTSQPEQALSHQHADYDHADHDHADHSHHPHHSDHANHSHHAHESHPAHASVSVAAHHHASNRHLPEIEQLILAAHLPQRVTDWSLAIFRRLAEAEGAVHGIAPDQVHFHEVGATDAIVDIVGTCLGLDWLGIEQLYCSALPVGGGTVWAAHGYLPVPPPAVLKLWEMRQVPLYSNGIDQELVTPTGAAIVTTLATDFGAPPALILRKVGLGAGSKDFAIPNILRLWIGEANRSARTAPAHRTASSASPNPALSYEPEQETIVVLETQIDDLNPQAIGYVMTELLTQGALDVFTQAIGMKKSRPGTLLTVICRPEQAANCEAILFRETTTLGIRHSSQQRTALQRAIEMVATAYGQVRIKVARNSQGKVINVQPEYEDCAQLAQQQQLPWREVHRLALQAWYATEPAAALGDF